MQIKEIMTRNPECIDSGKSLDDAARKMSSLDVGILPVKKDDRIVGIITDRDIVIRGLAKGKDPKKTSVSDVMSPEVVCCHESDDVESAGEMMEDRQVRRLLVCDANEKPVGIVSLGDLAVKSHQEEFSGEVLERVCEPSHRQR